MKGHIYRRCKCSLKEDGKTLTCGGRCREGRWYFQLTLPDGRRPHRGGFLTKKEAEEAARDVIEEAKKAPSGKMDRKVTVREWFEAWNTDRMDIRATSREQNRLIIANYIVPNLGDRTMVSIQHDDIQRLYNKIAKRGAKGEPLSPGSLRRVHATVRAGFGAAVRRRKLPFNPAEYVTLPMYVRPTPQVWSFAETADAMRRLVDDPMYPLYATAANTGMRRGELCGLRWDRVNLDEAYIRVELTRVKISHDVVEAPAKSRSGTRILYLDQDLVTLLRAHKDQQIARAEELGLRWEEDCHVFTNAVLEPLHPEHVSKGWRLSQKECGVQRSIKLHELRHTHLTQFQAVTTNLKSTSDRAGHASVSFTADTYTQVLADEARAAAEEVRKRLR